MEFLPIAEILNEVPKRSDQTHGLRDTFYRKEEFNSDMQPSLKSLLLPHIWRHRSPIRVAKNTPSREHSTALVSESAFFVYLGPLFQAYLMPWFFDLLLQLSILITTVGKLNQANIVLSTVYPRSSIFSALTIAVGNYGLQKLYNIFGFFFCSLLFDA